MSEEQSTVNGSSPIPLEMHPHEPPKHSKSTQVAEVRSGLQQRHRIAIDCEAQLVHLGHRTPFGDVADDARHELRLRRF